MAKKRSPYDTSEEEEEEKEYDGVEHCNKSDESHFTSPRLSKYCRAEGDTCVGTDDRKKEMNSRNIVEVHQWWPTKSRHQYTVKFKIEGDYEEKDQDSCEKDSSPDADTLFKALAFSLSHHSSSSKITDDTQDDCSTTPPSKTSISISQQIRQELGEFGTSKQIWTQYCHHIYMQHQKSLSQLRLCDLTCKSEKKSSLDQHDEEEQQHAKAQEIYMKYMTQNDASSPSGSILELIFASLKYKLNAIVLQYIQDKSHFVAYNFNPGYRKKAYFLNVGKPEAGKWRYLRYIGISSKTESCSNTSLLLLVLNDPTPGLIQPGIYTTHRADRENTMLELCLNEPSSSSSTSTTTGCSSRTELVNKAIPSCTLQLFNRLLTGTARPDEFTLVLSHDDENDIHHSGGAECKQGQTIDTESAKFILFPRSTQPNSKSSSTFAFKSIENLDECKEWCKRITKTLEPQVIAVQSTLQQQRPVTIPFLTANSNRTVLPTFHTLCSLVQSEPGLIMSSSSRKRKRRRIGKEDEKTQLEFHSLPHESGTAQWALVQDDQYSSPQIILKFAQGGNLFQQANHDLFFKILNNDSSNSSSSSSSSPNFIQLSLFNPEMDEYEPSEKKHGSFRVDKGTTFHLRNPSTETIQLRCAWFL